MAGNLSGKCRNRARMLMWLFACKIMHEENTESSWNFVVEQKEKKTKGQH